jgi:phosphoglycolate phosphatase-like HAD superfamily hydrolase
VLEPPQRFPIFDLDGTLVDSDDALLAPFIALGIQREAIPPLGMLLEDACLITGISVDDYLASYDPTLVRPFPGAAELLGGLERWAVCSHKLRAAGDIELALLGWRPERSLFAEDFDGGPKRLDLLLADLGLAPTQAVFVGDTDHDRSCAAAAGVPFFLAGWNPRALAHSEVGDRVLSHPGELLAHL